MTLSTKVDLVSRNILVSDDISSVTFMVLWIVLACSMNSSERLSVGGPFDFNIVNKSEAAERFD